MSENEECAKVTRERYGNWNATNIRIKERKALSCWLHNTPLHSSHFLLPPCSRFHFHFQTPPFIFQITLQKLLLLFFNFFLILTDIEVSESEALEILNFATRSSDLDRSSGSNTNVIHGMC